MTRTEPDARFPFPATTVPTRCRRRPELFDLAFGDLGGDTKKATQERLEQARQACSARPMVTVRLRRALVNKPLAREGVFAGTTPGQRNALRRRLADRFGPEWIDVVAARDQARRKRTETARHTPLSVPQARVVRLDRELNGPLSLPPLTAGEQRLNRNRLTRPAAIPSSQGRRSTSRHPTADQPPPPCCPGSPTRRTPVSLDQRHRGLRPTRVWSCRARTCSSLWTLRGCPAPPPSSPSLTPRRDDGRTA